MRILSHARGPHRIVSAILLGLPIGLVTVPSADAASVQKSDALFKRIDADSDGFLTEEEVPVEKRKLLRRLLRTSDENGDGRLSATEFANALTPKRPPKPIETLRQNRVPGAEALVVLLARFDANGDGRIVEREVPDDWANAFDEFAKRADQNKDGVLSRFEIVRGGPQMARAAAQIARRLEIDVPAELKRLGPNATAAMESMSRPPAGRDGLPSPKEILKDPTTLAELFEYLDQDGDGQIRRGEVPENRRDRFSRLIEHADENRDHKLNRGEFVQGMRVWARFEVAREKRARQRGDDAKRARKKNDRAADLERRSDPAESDSGGAKEPRKSDRRKNHADNGQLNRILRLDKDGDGKISRKEARGPIKKQFGEIDRNGNGLLERGEIMHFSKRLRSRRQRNRT